ncbi:MAG: hypothetical protein RL172_19 [Bacteroidota bacterium]
MRITLLIFSLAYLFTACSKSPVVPAQNYLCSLPFADSSTTNNQHTAYAGLLQDMAAAGVPGVMMAIQQPGSGLWLGAAGKADMQTGTLLQPCNISRMGSTVKTFTAVTILLLQQDGLLKLDDKAANYLPADVVASIDNAGTASIRQLLNHSSGIYNYIQNLQFQTASLNQLTKEWQPNELLAYAQYKTAYFKPGTDTRYSNTNYILLGMIIENITGKPFWDAFQQKIFNPSGMTSTHFAATDKVPANIIRGYADLYSNLHITDATYYSGWDYYTADGGLISTVYDLTIFMQRLFSGQLINAASLTEMLQTVTPSEMDEAFFPIANGLGIFKINTPWGIAWMHSGDAIGYYACMLYFPGTQTSIVWAANGNYGKIDKHVSSKAAMENIFKVVFK